MSKKKLLISIFLPLIFIISSCSDDVIYYKYKGVTITRVDKGNEIYFYYGLYDEAKQFPNSYIKAEYRGFNSDMSAFLIFSNNGKVIIYRVSASFDKEGNDTSLILADYIDNYYFCKWRDSINGNFNNVIEIMSAINFEKERNKNDNHTKVKAIYPQ